MSSAISGYVQSAQDIITRRKLGGAIGNTEERAAEIAEEIRQLYEEIKDDIENASDEKLETINELMIALNAADSGVKDYYESKDIYKIRMAINKELKRRDPNNKTSSEVVQETGAETEQEMQGLDNRTGNKDPDILASYTPDVKTSVDEIIGDGSDFLNTGKNNQGGVMVNGDNVKKASNMLFNVLFTIAIAASILIGMYLGIKFMMSSAEDKASIKESLLPYFVGVIIMLASFSIWKLVLTLLQSIDKI